MALKKKLTGMMPPGQPGMGMGSMGGSPMMRPPMTRSPMMKPPVAAPPVRRPPVMKTKGTALSNFAPGPKKARRGGKKVPKVGKQFAI